MFSFVKKLIKIKHGLYLFNKLHLTNSNYDINDMTTIQGGRTMVPYINSFAVFRYKILFPRCQDTFSPLTPLDIFCEFSEILHHLKS